MVTVRLKRYVRKGHLAVAGIFFTSAFGILSLIQFEKGSMVSTSSLLITSSSTVSSSLSSSSVANMSKPLSTSLTSPPPPPPSYNQEERVVKVVEVSADPAGRVATDKINISSNTITTSNEKAGLVAGTAAGAAAGSGNAKAPTPASRARRKRRQEEQVETPPAFPPRPESLHKNATVSACLIIRDDNEILPEWLAYHYHAVGLRHLIVAIDPLSRESPSSILQQWRNTTDLEVVEWTDEHFMPANFLKHQQPPSEYMIKSKDVDVKIFYKLSQEALLEISNHLYRQRVFLAKCMKTHRQKGNSWVMHTDTDEYIVASKLLRRRNPGYLDMPNMTQPNSVLRLLQQAVRKTAHVVRYPCISMSRVLFGPVESGLDEINHNVPARFNASSFETLRWQYHALKINGPPKMILDVAAIPDQYFANEVAYHVHYPIEEICPENFQDLTNFRKNPITVNHYLGSWERYASRNDKRRSREVYNMKANSDKIDKDDGIQEWLMGFCNLVGHDLASELLGPSYISHQQRHHNH